MLRRATPHNRPSSDTGCGAGSMQGAGICEEKDLLVAGGRGESWEAKFGQEELQHRGLEGPRHIRHVGPMRERTLHLIKDVLVRQSFVLESRATEDPMRTRIQLLAERAEVCGIPGPGIALRP